MRADPRPGSANSAGHGAHHSVGSRDVRSLCLARLATDTSAHLPRRPTLTSVVSGAIATDPGRLVGYGGGCMSPVPRGRHLRRARGVERDFHPPNLMERV